MNDKSAASNAVFFGAIALVGVVFVAAIIGTTLYTEAKRPEAKPVVTYEQAGTGGPYRKMQ